MSLSFHFNLTAAQSTLLQICAFGHYKRADDNPQSPLMPEYQSTFFMNSANSLKRKGLLSHDAKREPSWMATTEGNSVALLIASAARSIVNRADNAKPIHKKTLRVKTAAR